MTKSLYIYELYANGGHGVVDKVVRFEKRVQPTMKRKNNPTWTESAARKCSETDNKTINEYADY